MHSRRRDGVGWKRRNRAMALLWRARTAPLGSVALRALFQKHALLLTIPILLSIISPATASPQAGDGGRAADSNNSVDTATPLARAGFVTDSLDPLDDPVDIFRLEAESGKIISASIYIIDYNSSSPDRANLSLVLLDSKQREIVASRSSYRYESFRALAVSGGTYYLRVELAPGSGASGYTMDYGVGEAQILEDGQEIHGYLTDSGNRNSDWYRVNLTGGANPDRFVATMEEDSTAFFDLYFMDLWNGYSFWYDISWWGDPEERVEAVATYTGWYYLQVNAYAGYGNYVLRVLIAPGTGDGDSEPGSATQVGWNSSYRGTVDQSLDHYDWYVVEVDAGEELRASLRLEPQPVDMFSLSILSSDLSTVESRTNFVSGNPPSLAPVITISKTLVSGGTYYIVVMAKVGLKSNPADLSDRNARSDYVLSIEFSMHPPPPANRPPEALVPGIRVEFDRNTEYILNLTTLFRDPDGDRLSYSASGAVKVRVLFSEQNTATLIPSRNWYGSENITLTATDPYDARVTAWVDITVRRVALPPEIASRIPEAENLTASCGTEINFVVEATDPEHLPLTYRWFEGARELVNTTASIVWRVPAESGVVRISVIVSNGQTSTTAQWNVTCTPPPPLRVTIITPLNNTIVRRGETVSFYAMIPGLPSAQQRDYLFTWYLDGKVLSELHSFNTTELPAGKIKVTVRVMKRDDPARSGQASVTLRVVENGGPGVEWGPAALALAAIIVVVLTTALLVRRMAARKRALRKIKEKSRSARKQGRGRRGGRR